MKTKNSQDNKMHSSRLNKEQLAELMQLQADGKYRPKDIVDFARNPKTALHHKFVWNNRVAGEQHRLWQARVLIVSVTIIPQGSKIPVRAMVSLTSDRNKPGGGYRAIEAVMRNKQQRDELLAQALAEFQYWRLKYQNLVALRPIFQAADKVDVKMNGHARKQKTTKTPPRR